MLSLDGTTGKVIVGAVSLAASEPPEEFQTILGWADAVRKGKLKVRANADNGPDARTLASSVPRASACAAPSTCSSVRIVCRSCGAMILATDPDEEAAALEALRKVPEGRLRGDPRGDGRAARHGAPARPAAARVPAQRRGAGDQGGHRRPRLPRSRRCTRPPARWHEFNPMLGTRGVRLGVVKPGLYAMQVRALMEAAAARVAKGGKPDRRDDDPAHRHPRGDGRGPPLGRGGRRRGHQGSEEADRRHHRHHDRDARAPRCAPTRSPRRPTSSASAPTTSRR